jgi:multisubunit Na+/H+ antiporter MnhC subunit
MYRLDVYKLRLGFLEKLVLLLLAAIGIPSIAGTVTLPTVIVIAWAVIGVILVAFYVVLSVKAQRLADTLDEERKKV